MTDALKIEIEEIREKVGTMFRIEPSFIEYDLECWENGEFALVIIVPRRQYYAMCSTCASVQFTRSHKEKYPDTEIGYITFNYKRTTII